LSKLGSDKLSSLAGKLIDRNRDDIELYAQFAFSDPRQAKAGEVKHDNKPVYFAMPLRSGTYLAIKREVKERKDAEAGDKVRFDYLSPRFYSRLECSGYSKPQGKPHQLIYSGGYLYRQFVCQDTEGQVAGEGKGECSDKTHVRCPYDGRTHLFFSVLPISAGPAAVETKGGQGK
jgi:hypothetical protein